MERNPELLSYVSGVLSAVTDAEMDKMREEMASAKQMLKNTLALVAKLENEKNQLLESNQNLCKAIEEMQKDTEIIQKENIVLNGYIDQILEKYSYLIPERIHRNEKGYVPDPTTRCFVCNQWPRVIQEDSKNAICNCRIMRDHYDSCPKMRDIIAKGLIMEVEVEPGKVVTTLKKEEKHEKKEEKLPSKGKPLSVPTICLDTISDGLITAKDSRLEFNNMEQLGDSKEDPFYGDFFLILFFVQMGLRTVNRIMNDSSLSYSEKFYTGNPVCISDQWTLLFDKSLLDTTLNHFNTNFLNSYTAFTLALTQLAKKLKNSTCFCIAGDQVSQCHYCPGVTDQCQSQTLETCIHRFQHLVDFLILLFRRISKIQTSKVAEFWNFWNQLWKNGKGPNFILMLKMILDHLQSRFCNESTQKECLCKSQYCYKHMNQIWTVFLEGSGPGDFLGIQAKINALCQSDS